ncbi:type IX secretion system anionic LPS delivery protein PorZ [Psychroflexus salis]|uniref:ABC transporter substrate-binding protein n=1 Tax=Psychroflexus salis TaxID=1526574 RepID=A0A917E7Y1_9FLAO|nr:T9SS type A sorting domain-containing protein [Psychroflexus salis]GGE13808.1 ABC transporter substrate-binding protein [Psychroflexus salis]
MKKINLFLLLFACSFSIIAQEFPAWQGHFSYLNIGGLSQGNGKIVASAENAFFNYEPNLDFTTTFNSVNGLSGKAISAIHYSEEFELTIIGFENGLLQIVRDHRSRILNFVDIVNRVTIAPNQKQINHILEHNGVAYLSTDFGVVTFNLSNREFGDTYFIGDGGTQLAVNQTTVNNNIIYAATNLGLFAGNLNNPNLIDFNNWLQIDSTTFRTITSFNNQVFLTNSANSLFVLSELNNTLNFVNSFSTNIRDLRVSANQLLVVTRNQVFSYDENLNEEIPVFEIDNLALNLNTAIVFNETFYLADANLGLLEFNANSGIPTAEFLSPNGPLLNRVFSLAASTNQLWVTYGEYNELFNPFPLNTRGVSHLVEENWTNIQASDLDNARVLTHTSIDPNNPNRAYISSYIDGLLIVENETLVTRLSQANSGIEGVGGNLSDNRIGASVFTPNGDLYFSNSITENPLKKLTPDGSVETINLSSVITNPTSFSSAKIATDAQGNVYLGTRPAGVLAYQPSTNTAGRISSEITGVDFPEVTNANPAINALAVDNSNRLWIGTSDGLRVMFNPASLFTSNTNINVSPIIIVEDDGVAQELLFEQAITDIVVDGANNKWIGTADSGIFQVSSNGQDVLNQFTIANSPLPSNNITSIAIDGSNGEVYIGTTNGLVSFNSKITDANEDLSDVRVFPNPVRPNYTGEVTVDGLTENANVKITDITGNLVFEQFASGGSIRWDTSAFGKHKVASGVYLVLITGSDEVETEVKKIMIVR